MGTRDQELSNANSCFNQSRDNEPMFVLCARDSCAPAAILDWVRWRIGMGRNNPDDDQILEAIQIARDMAAWREQWIR